MGNVRPSGACLGKDDLEDVLDSAPVAYLGFPLPLMGHWDSWGGGACGDSIGTPTFFLTLDQCQKGGRAISQTLLAPACRSGQGVSPTASAVAEWQHWFLFRHQQEVGGTDSLLVSVGRWSLWGISPICQLMPPREATVLPLTLLKVAQWWQRPLC